MLRKLFLSLLALSASSVISLAASWSFSTAPTLYNTEGMSSACWLGNTLYVGINGVSGGQPYGRIVKYASGTWSDVTNGTTDGNIYALSAVADYYGVHHLFVGGEFVSVGSSALTVNNVAKLILSSTPYWIQMTGGTAVGTDGPVYSLYAIDYAYSSGGFTYHQQNVYAGGDFSNAGNINSPSIARWWGVVPTWQSVGGGVTGTVLGISVDYSTYTSTTVNAVYLAGDFAKAINGTNTYNAAKYTTSWNWIGQGLGRLGNYSAYEPCSNYFYGPYVYRSYAVALYAGTAYYAGIFSCVSDKSGDLDYDLVPTAPPACADGSDQPVAQLSSTGYLTLTDKYDLKFAARSLAVKGSTIYCAGGMGDTNGNTIYAAKLVSGNWVNITPNDPTFDAGLVVAGSTYVYFIGNQVHAYLP